MKKNYHYQVFNVHATPEDIAMVKNLRENHAINISGMFKIFLKHLEKQLNKIDYDSDIKKC